MTAWRNQKSALKERGDDFYPSPLEAVDSLLQIEREFLPQSILEPACGDGAIVMPFRRAGYNVHAFDLVERGCPTSESGVDFLMPFPIPDDIGGIVTNPPFKLAGDFLEKSLSIAPYVAFLLRLAFLEGNERKQMFANTPLARVHISSRRLPMMHRGGWDGPVSTSTVAFAWFVWDRRWQGEPVIRWFDWKDHADGLSQRSAVA
jgi:hypothetical protein